MQFYVEILLLRAIAGHIGTNDENTMSLATRNNNIFCKKYWKHGVSGPPNPDLKNTGWKSHHNSVRKIPFSYLHMKLFCCLSPTCSS